MTVSTTVRNEFDPEPDAAYGRCLDCDLVLLDEAAASQHSQDTLAPTGTARGLTASGHLLRVTNPTRERRIASKVATIVDDAIVEVVNDLLALVGPNKASTEEITHAVRFYSDFAESWQEALDENYDDDGEPIENEETSDV